MCDLFIYINIKTRCVRVFLFSLWMWNTTKQTGGGGYVYTSVSESHRYLLYHHWVYARLRYLKTIGVRFNQSAFICKTPQIGNFSFENGNVDSPLKYILRSYTWTTNLPQSAVKPCVPIAHPDNAFNQSGDTSPAVTSGEHAMLCYTSKGNCC